MQQIHAPSLWLGNSRDLRDPRALFAAEIQAVVDLAFEEPPSLLPRELIYCRFPLHDGEGNAPDFLRLALQTIVDLLAADIRTLVACSMGMSRSPTLAAYALAGHLQESPQDILWRISEEKALDVKGPLWNELADVFPRLRC